MGNLPAHHTSIAVISASAILNIEHTFIAGNLER
jgi:hypothetical protein